jgi:WD40 repeat protein
MAFSPGGNLLAFAGDDHSVQLADVASGGGARVLTAHDGPVRSVAFSPNVALLASAGDDRVVRVCSVETGRQVRVLEGHLGALSSVVFSPDGTLLASGGADLTVRVWELRTGSLLATLVSLDKGGWAVLLPDGSYKLAGNPAGCFWWAVGRSTFGPGELDDFDPAVSRLDEDAPILGITDWPTGAGEPDYDGPIVESRRLSGFASSRT